MNRREFLMTAGAAAASLSQRGLLAADDARPNLLVIHTDEHNFRTLGCYRKTLPPEQAFMWGEATVETPHIDWLADHGALCTSFYATTPVCSPSRASFVSGRYPQNTPVVTNNIAMDDGIVTFAEILRLQGYATGYAGKWHLDGHGKPQWAPQRKFGFTDNRYMFNRGHWKQLEDTPDGPRVKARNAKGAPSYGVGGANETSFTTDFLTDKTIAFVRAHKDVPFCYMLSLPDPHGPDTVRPPYDTMFASQTYEKPRTADKPSEGLPSWGRKQKGGFNQSRYYGMVKCIDDSVGRILGTLRACGVLEKTIVVFTADHGDLRGEHHRHNKGVPYEGSAKIPFLMYYPARIKGGTVINEALGCVDFLPTVLSLMGQKTAGLEEGRDASALFGAGRAPEGWRDVAFMRSTGPAERGWLAAITSRYKLVCSVNDQPWLFDLQEDPDEVTNRFLRPEYRETVRALSKQLRAYCRDHRDARGDAPRIKADLAWAIEGAGDYVPPPMPVKADRPARGKRNRKGRRKSRATEK